MNDRHYRDEIVRLEEQIDELAARIESCRKFILAGRIAVIGGGAVLVAILIGALEFNPSVMAVAVAGVLGGIVAAGSNHSTAREAQHELTGVCDANHWSRYSVVNEALSQELISIVNACFIADRFGRIRVEDRYVR